MFVGILLDKSTFFGLFDKLSSYFKKNSLEESIILQDINSLHLSLYYLDKELPENSLNLLTKIRKDLKNLKLNITSFNYFYDQQKERIAYFEANHSKRLKEANQVLRSNLPNNVLENSYSYVPHVTIFRIKDYSIFKKHKKNLEKILSNFSKEIEDKNVFKGVNFFKVDSTKESEAQLIAEKLYRGK